MVRSLRCVSHLSSQTPRTQEELAQRAAALGCEHPPDCGELLRETPRYLRPSQRAAPRATGFAGSSGGAGCAAQLLHLAQRSARPPPPGLCRLVGMVISTHTKRLTASAECYRHSAGCWAQ